MVCNKMNMILSINGSISKHCYYFASSRFQILPTNFDVIPKEAMEGGVQRDVTFMTFRIFGPFMLEISNPRRGLG